MIRDSKRIAEVLKEGESNSRYYCDTCSWAENAADLSSCLGCGVKLVCRECRDRKGRCVSCADFNLLNIIEIVGDSDKRDINVIITTWVGAAVGAIHYYIDFREPKWKKYGRLKLSDEEETYWSTEDEDKVNHIIRLRLIEFAKRNEKAIKRRSGKRLKVYIGHKKTVAKFMKYGQLDGD